MAPGLFLVDVTNPDAETPPPLLAYDTHDDPAIGHVEDPVPVVPLADESGVQSRWFALSGNGDSTPSVESRLLLLALDQPARPLGNRGGLRSPSRCRSSPAVADLAPPLSHWDRTAVPALLMPEIDTARSGASTCAAHRHGHKRWGAMTSSGDSRSLSPRRARAYASALSGRSCWRRRRAAPAGLCRNGCLRCRDRVWRVGCKQRPAQPGARTPRRPHSLGNERGCRLACRWWRPHRRRLAYRPARRPHPDDLVSAGPDSLLLIARDADGRSRAYLLDPRSGLPAGGSVLTGRVLASEPLVTVHAEQAATQADGSSTQVVQTRLWQIVEGRMQSMGTHRQRRQLGRLNWREVLEEGIR